MPKHWYHKSLKDCTNWYEPTTEWHLGWQNEFPEQNREIVIKDNATGITHRADIKLDNGLTIEVQHSSIDIDEVRQREDFYSKVGMVWILDGANLAKHSKISYVFKQKCHSLRIEIPPYVEKVKNYDMDVFRELIFERTSIKDVLNNKLLKAWDIDNGNSIEMDFQSSIDFSSISEQLRYEINQIIRLLYDSKDSELVKAEIDISYINRSFSSYENIYLHKKFWRKFIDEIKSPIFVDNLSGLKQDCLFWYQKKTIISRSELINKLIQNKIK